MTLYSRRMLALALLGHLVDGSSIISECSSKLPMSLSTVISDLEAEGVTEVGTACFLTSSSVTRAKKVDFFGIEDISSTCFGTASGVCLALSPSSVTEVASTAVACGGDIIYYPDGDDLSRGEGLFDSLGPAIERIVNEGIETSSLIVVSSNPSATKPKLEDAASELLSNLVSPLKKISVLEDVFGSVRYVESADHALALLSKSEEPAQAKATVANTVASDFWQNSPAALSSLMSAKDLAAARQLGPAARKAYEIAVETVRQMTDGQVVSNFGELCEAATKRALDDLDASSSSALASSNIGKQIRANLRDEIAGDLAELSESQLGMLKDQCFNEFKQDLSKLRISPNLPSDMEATLAKSVASFARKSKKMPVGNGDAKASYKSQLQEFCSERLLAARASGQFKPVPRKGVTIGLHWLLPKPFGNDFRQEPWMVHATDNLVYVPQDKISDVSPEEVASGDWRNKIVPCPAGNEMIYMQ